MDIYIKYIHGEVARDRSRQFLLQFYQEYRNRLQPSCPSDFDIIVNNNVITNGCTFGYM
jgi:hypothetical protein